MNEEKMLIINTATIPLNLLPEFMFYYLTDKGDIGNYEIKTTEPLKWMGINIEAKPAGEKDHK